MDRFLIGGEEGWHVATWGLLVALGLLLCLATFKFLCIKYKVDKKHYDFFALLGFVSAFVGFVFAWLFDNFYKFLESGGTWGIGGFTLMGGVVGGAGTFIVGTIIFTNTKNSLWATTVTTGLLGVACGIVLFGNNVGFFVGGILGLVIGVALGVAIGYAILKSYKRDNGFFKKHHHPEYGKSFWQVVNFAVIGVTIAVAIGRVGCFFAGCCYGKSVDDSSVLGGTGVDFNWGNSVGRVYPTNIFESFFMFILLAVLLLSLKSKHKNQVLIFGYVYGVFRFLLEYIRGDDRGGYSLGMSPSQIQTLVLVLFVTALAVFILVSKRVPFDGKQKQAANA